MAFTNESVTAVCFVLVIIAQLRCISSISLRASGSLEVIADSNDASLGVPIGDVPWTEPGKFTAADEIRSEPLLEEDSRSQSFLDVSAELDTSALMKRVDQVQNMASTQNFAVQAQQQALVGLQQEQEILEARLAALGAPAADEKTKGGADEKKDEQDKKPKAGESDDKADSDDKAAESADKADKRKGVVKKAVDDKKGGPVGEADEQAHFLCSPKVGHACSSFHGYGGDSGCTKYGNSNCNKDSRCVCDDGFCADGHGNCRSKEKARLLPDMYRMELHQHLGAYLYMQDGEEGAKALDFSMGKPGRNGHFHIVINTDDSVMLYTNEWGPDHFMSVTAVNSTTGKPIWKDDMSKFTSPYAASFEIYEDEKKLIYLKDIRTELWVDATRKFGGNAIMGREEFPGESGAFIFDPPLPKGLKLMKASARRMWPLLPFLLLVASVLG